MTNEIQRKITSLTLMTIMLAGGMTIAFPGFTPDAYAVNANLIVSAEDTGSFDGAQIIEISIIDDDLDSDASPQVTLNGDTVTMTRAIDAWYAYIANDEAVLAVDNGSPGVVSGIDFGQTGECGDTDSGAVNKYCGVETEGVTFVPASQRGERTATWPFIQTYDFSSVTIQYNKAGGTQITTLEYDNNDVPGLSLDRGNYPQGAHVHISIDDQRLNIDPTADDYWSWNITDMDNITKYYGAVATDGVVNAGIIETPQVCEEDCVITIDYNRNSDDLVDNLLRLDPESFDDVPNDGTWFAVGEDGGPNTGIFTATDLSDNSLLRVTDDASRDSSALITYDGTETGIDIKFNTATIDITSPDDVWTSGSAIPIIVVDNDANKNDYSDEVLGIEDPSSIIPTLTLGDPFTLGEVSNNLVTWVGWSVADENAEFIRLLATASDTFTTPESLNYTVVDGDNPFTLKGFPLEPTNGVYADDDGDDAKPNAVVLQQAAEVELFSERAILEFGVEFSTEAMTSLNALAGIDQFGNEPDMNNGSFMQADFLVIDFDDNLGALQDSLIGDPDKTTVGYNFLNYDVRSLGATPTSLQILLGGTTVGEAIDLGESQDYININATTLFADDLDATKPLQFKLNFNNDLAVKSGEKYPIVIDFFSFGYENDGEASDERIANQIIRFELEEDGTQGSFEGTLQYIMINQININSEETYQGIAPISDTPSFIVIEDLTSGSAPSVTYLDRDVNDDPVQVSAQQDAPSHTGVVTLDVESFKAGDTVTVTLEDLDLNTNPDLTDRYTVVSDPTAVNHDAVGVNTDIGRLLEITFDDNRWTDYDRDDCAGLGDSGFTLSETGASTGIFVGTFAIPNEICINDDGTTQLVTGLDIDVNYVDFRDRSGEITEIGASAGIKASTGSVSLDRTVYPVPFGVPGDFEDSNSSTPF